MARTDLPPAPTQLPAGCDCCHYNGPTDRYGQAEHAVTHLEWQTTRCSPAARRQIVEQLAAARATLIGELRAHIERVKTDRGRLEDRVEVLTFERDDALRLADRLEARIVELDAGLDRLGEHLAHAITAGADLDNPRGVS